MPLWATPITVKVTLRSPTGVETRRVVLPVGTGTNLAEFLTLLQERFAQPLARRMRYTDAAGDELTITSDTELREALAEGAERFEVTAAHSEAVAAPQSGEKSLWELVETGERVEAGAEVPPAAVEDCQWAAEVRFWLNGEEVVLENPSPAMTLLEWLREVKGVTGVHVGCGEGGCGICTVSLARKDPFSEQIRQVPINSCLRRLCALDGCHILTSEGIGCQKSGFHSVQKAIADGNGSQCGFCTPGWVMNMYSLLERKGKDAPTAEEVEQHFDGNLCRCTGYRPILSAFGKFAVGGQLCGQHASVPQPPALLAHEPRPLRFEDPRTGEEWYRPTSMEEFAAAARQAAGKTLRPVCGSTADGVVKYYAPEDHSQAGTVFVDVSLLPELQGVRLEADGLFCGATASIEEVIDALKASAKEVPAFGVLAEHMRRIASVQIRSVGSWAGNVMLTREYPTFPSDMVTILMAAGATFEGQFGSDAARGRLSMQQLLDLKGNALLVSMKIPKPPQGAVFQTFKTAQRSVFAHAIVNFGAYMAFEASGHTVSEARIALGGTCEKLLDASRTAQALRGRAVDQSSFNAALAVLKEEIAAHASADQRSSAAYREQLAAGFLYKTFLAARASLPERLRSALVPFIPMAARPVSSGAESFGTAASEAPVSQWLPKRASRIQASGEAVYPSDFGGHGALFGQLVLSTRAKARLLALDPTEALRMPGVFDFVGASAVPGLNCVNGPIGGENLKEKIFFEVNDVIPCVGSVLGIVLAASWREARAAAKRVSQRYADAGPAVASIADAVQLRRAAPAGTALAALHQRGARPELAAGVEFVNESAETRGGLTSLKGVFKTGGQKHFYMETQSVCVIPHDGDRWEVICSDQYCDFTQGSLAMVLGVPMHHINVKVPRAGGGFGGKLTRQLLGACAAAVAARKHQRPVRVQNERSDDCRLVGGREPLDFAYEVSFDASGRVDTMNLGITMDPGWFYGDASGDMAMAVGWSDNCYQYRSFKVSTQAACTDTPHMTSMRAPGCMQSVLAAEVVMEHIAKTVGKPLEEVQALNFYNVEESPTTPFGDHIGKDGYNWTIPLLWKKIQEEQDFAMRQAEVAGYNRVNRWTKRGIAISPAKYVMDDSFYSSGALVCIYSDGTVLVSSGGSEIGQGISTKVALCVAQTLDAPLEKVQVGPRETSKVPGNSATGGSGTSECSSEAAILACQKLVAALEPFRKGGKTWEQAVTAATAAKVGLMATAWYAHKNKGSTNSYATYGTAISEVEIDVLTGEVRVERVDVLMDLGVQLDAAVDIGQLQGGFIIALGYLLTEELKVDKSGTQLNLGTWDYKIPSAYDIPVQFNVSLLKDSPNPVGIKGSKASAEPAMCLMPSVYLAVKNAIYAARSELGLGEGWFSLGTPITPEAIRAAVGTPESQMLLPA